MRGNKQINIVILDDVKENLYELAALVEDLGYVARPVLTIAQAIKALRMGDVTLLILDIAMPEMSGFEFLRRIRGEKWWEEIPVVFLSAYQDIETKAESFELGACDYIVRPFEKIECGYRIRKAVGMALQLKGLKQQKDAMQQMFLYKEKETKEAKRQVMEVVCMMASELEASPGHFERVRMSVVHFAKGLSVVPEFEQSISEKFVEELEVAAPCYVFASMPERSKELRGLMESQENEYLTMAVEIAEYYGATYEEGNTELPLSAQIVSLAVYYDLLPFGAKESMERLEQEVKGKVNPLLVHAFQIIQSPYYLDKEERVGVS